MLCHLLPIFVTVGKNANKSLYLREIGRRSGGKLVARPSRQGKSLAYISVIQWCCLSISGYICTCMYSYPEENFVSSWTENSLNQERTHAENAYGCHSSVHGGVLAAQARCPGFNSWLLCIGLFTLSTHWERIHASCWVFFSFSLNA